MPDAKHAHKKLSVPGHALQINNEVGTTHRMKYTCECDAWSTDGLGHVKRAHRYHLTCVIERNKREQSAT